MKKTLLAIAVPTLILTGCFGSGTDKATYVAPTPQVSPKPQTNAHIPETKPETKKETKPVVPSVGINHGNTQVIRPPVQNPSVSLPASVNKAIEKLSSDKQSEQVTKKTELAQMASTLEKIQEKNAQKQVTQQIQAFDEKMESLRDGTYSDKTDKVDEYESLFKEIALLTLYDEMFGTDSSAQINEKTDKIQNLVNDNNLQELDELVGENSKVLMRKIREQFAQSMLETFSEFYEYKVSGFLDDTALAGDSKYILQTETKSRKLEELIKDTKNDISVSLKNAVHGILDGDKPKFFYQGYATPNELIGFYQYNNTADTTIKYAGDAFVKAGGKVIKGTSQFDVNLGNADGGTISGAISYDDQTIALTDGLIVPASNTFEAKASPINSIGSHNVSFRGSFYGVDASELAGYFEEESGERRKGTFGASKQ